MHKGRLLVGHIAFGKILDGQLFDCLAACLCQVFELEHVQRADETDFNFQSHDQMPSSLISPIISLAIVSPLKKAEL